MRIALFLIVVKMTIVRNVMMMTVRKVKFRRKPRYDRHAVRFWLVAQYLLFKMYNGKIKNLIKS